MDSFEKDNKWNLLLNHSVQDNKQLGDKYMLFSVVLGYQ